MTDYPTDTYELTITIIQHGDLAVMNVDAPAQVEANTPFVIEYDCINNGETDMCYGRLIEDGSDVDRWDDTINAAATKHVVVNMPGRATTLNATIEVGYAN